VNINAQVLTVSSQISHNLFRARVCPSLHSSRIPLAVFWFECLLTENGLAIMTMTTFKVSTAAVHLLAIACIMLVVVQVTEAARELDDGVCACPVPSSLLTMSAALQLVRRACRGREIAAVDIALQFIRCRLLGLVTRTRSQNLRRSLRSVNLKIVVCGVHVWLLLFLSE
jgi:hypothetical protein